MKKIISFVFALLVAFTSISAYKVQSVVSARMLIPLYSNPPAQWANVVNANAYGNIDVIINPNNGPGAVKLSNYTSGVATLRAGGVGVYGYIYTDYAVRPIATVQSEVDTWISWYGVDGIFLDEESNKASAIPYYTTIYNYIHAKGLKVQGNPGASSIEVYMNVADTTCIYENDPSQAIPFPSWAANYPASKFCALQYASSVAQMRTFVADAKSKNVGYVYVTDDVLTNPWDGLPPYLAEEAALLAGNVTSPTNTPSLTVQPSQTPSRTPTGSPVASATPPQATNTPTKTNTPVITTAPPSATTTRTFTPTASKTSTPSPTETQVIIPTVAATITPDWLPLCDVNYLSSGLCIFKIP
jgi:hypothetical protein